MKEQFRLYSVDTKAFYTDEEIDFNSLKFVVTNAKKKLEDWERYRVTRNCDISYDDYNSNTYRFNQLKLIENKKPSEEVEFNQLKEFFRKPKKVKNKSEEYITAQELKVINDSKENKLNKTIKENLSENEVYIQLKKLLNELNKEFSAMIGKSKERRLNSRALTQYNQISLFDNSLSRAMEIKSGQLVMDLVIVRAYHYDILKQLIVDGFTYLDEETGELKTYRVFTASAGQIRTKKVIFIEESKWEQYERTLMCGLTIADINNSSEGGCNINKFLAYLALCNSATDEIENFDIDRSIVIDDFETLVNGEVDYIDNVSFEVDRRTMDILIPHSDGCGWVLPTISKKNYMIRLPWVKGLMTPVDYIKFCDEYNKSNYKIKDIYGKEWDLKEDNIEYVFSKSQFKMYKYYSSWDEYKEKYKLHKCKANMCNLEPDTKEFRKASFNYQMWQTLTDIKDEEINEFTDKVDDLITRGYSDRETMLYLLGATKTNPKKTNLQKCLEVYPELIRDYHVKEELASSLNSKKKEAKYGKFKIDATYTFLIPDVFAWMENVFLGHKIPQGLLRDGEVSCKLKREGELLVNRSPHLYREHAVRNNMLNKDTRKWFTTDGVYTSTHDLISKILQFDVDGDKGLVVADDTLINIAKRNMKNIVPLYYEMGKAKAINVNKANIYESLTKAFSFNNIGKFSNKLTVMWNLENPDLKTIAQITALNNFTIDGAKTLLVPSVPKDVEKEMKQANGKLPYFFQFAKDKDKEDVAIINNSTVNRICRNIENIKQKNYDFSNVGKFKRTYLMSNPKIEINDEIITCYKELENKKNKLFIDARSYGITKEEIYPSVFNQIKQEFKKVCSNQNILVVEAIDMIIKYIYTTNRNCKKGFLFDLFGDVIYDNLVNNIKRPLGEKYIMCNKCGDRVEKKTINSNVKYCEICAKSIKLEQNKISYNKVKENVK